MAFISQNLILDSEKEKDFMDLLVGLFQAHQPQNATEAVLIEKMAIAL
jgi:hypothetical protein